MPLTIVTLADGHVDTTLGVLEGNTPRVSTGCLGKHCRGRGWKGDCVAEKAKRNGQEQDTCMHFDGLDQSTVEGEGRAY